MPLEDETPAQSMKRIEAELRSSPLQPIVSAQRGPQGYSANMGAAVGPLSGMAMTSADPLTGNPTMRGFRGSLGPVTFMHTQPNAPVQPTRTIGFGGTPFDADAYFGVNTTGKQFGVDVSTPLPAPRAPSGKEYEGHEGSFNAYGSYNPTRRDLNAGFELRRNFEHGGPVHMEEGGDPTEEPEIRPLTIHRKEAPPTAPVGEVEQPKPVAAPAPVDYGTVMDVMQQAQKMAEPTRMATPRQLATQIQPPEELPAVQEAQREKPRDALLAKMTPAQIQLMDQIGLELPENAASIGVDELGSYPMDAQGNRLQWERMSPAKWAFMQAGNIMGGIASPVKGAGMVVGAGPIRRGGQSAEEIVAAMSKMTPEEVTAIREANAGKGLDFPQEEAMDRLRLQMQRTQKSAEKGTELPGSPANDRIVIRGPEGKPDFVVGKLTPEDWVQRAEAMMSPQEIKEAADWYKTIRGEFLKYTNGDEAKADQYMRAWLVAQQNVDVAGAMNNVLTQREQLARNVPIDQMRAAGMPNPTEAARSVLRDMPIEGGVGQKIADFVDAAEGKTARSWMGNHPEGGAPFVVDVHTARDTGLVDETLLNHLRRLGYNEEDIAKAKVDLQGTPSATQYENRASWGRNELVDHLNDIKWQGKSDWTPAEAQAVGWMGMTRLTADKAEDVVSGIERNIRRISFEIAPGEGSPWAARFGERFAALPLQRQQEITRTIAEPAMEAASKLSGIDLTNLVHGTGGWNMYQNPAAVGQALATEHGAEVAANTLGYLLQQTEVWANNVKPMTKNPKAFAVDFIQEGKGGNNYLATNEGLQDFWDRVQKVDPTAGSKKPLFVGYQPIMTADGKPGIRVLIDRGGTKTQNALDEAIKGPLSKMLDEMPIEVSVTGHEAEINKARNDWKGQNDGKAYLERLEHLLGRNPAADLDPVRSKLEEIFERELSGGTKAQKGKAKGGEVKGYAKGGSVEDVKNALQNLRDTAKEYRVKRPRLAYMLRSIGGGKIDHGKSAVLAHNILNENVDHLSQRLDGNPRAIPTFKKLTEEIKQMHEK